MSFVLSVTMLAALALVGGAIFLWRKGGYGKQALLMLLLALIMIANLVIWTMPVADGASLANRADRP